MKVLSCVACRKRKIGCDRKWPSCTRCVVSGKKCGYPARKCNKKPQLSRVEQFEARLMNMETQFFSIDSPSNSGNSQTRIEESLSEEEEETPEWQDWNDLNVQWLFKSEGPKAFPRVELNHVQEKDFLPDARLQQALYHIYFERVQLSSPMIHKSKFFRALKGHPDCVPPLALRYAMWAVAAIETTEHQEIAEILYKMSRKHIAKLEMEGMMENLFLSCAQCWFLLASYETSRADFTRAWMSVGNCVRLVQIMDLYRLDGPHGEEHTLPQDSFTEKEEKRRIFWAAYLADRWASTLSGLPMSIKDEDIHTNLPSSEEAFEYEVTETGNPLRQVDGADSLAHLSPFAGSVFTTSILGRCLQHIHTQEDCDGKNLNSNYWESHRQIDTSISLTFMNLPSHLRLSSAVEDVRVVFLHFNLHVTAILLHQSAIKMSIKHRTDPSIRQRSLQRCLVSSVEIKNIVYSVRNLGTFSIHVWTSFCIYLAAGVFLDDVKTTRQPSTSSMDLGLLLIALNSIGARSTNVNNFARRLKADISRAGIGFYIPADLRILAGIRVPSRPEISDISSVDSRYCSTNEALYK